MAPRENDTLYLGPALETGISQWDTMADSLGKNWSKVSAEIEAMHAAAPWGDGPEGRVFLGTYMKDDAPTQLVETGTELVRHIADAGRLLREAISNSRGTEAQIAADLRRQANVRGV
ncbi:hypothetical protein ACFOY2_25230 [Nonomuraea purpurea]|uniref:WXG100 family type VII secretion target n=1 Tax=Nonomuraea purpurea TaxID=1849276 RepID=A0ABV8GCG2_9ACTN